LKGAESGLEWLGGYLGSDKFKKDEDRFLAGFAAMEQYGTLIAGRPWRPESLASACFRAAPLASCWAS
jgi:hypothetical protein